MLLSAAVTFKKSHFVVVELLRCFRRSRFFCFSFLTFLMVIFLKTLTTGSLNPAEYTPFLTDIALDHAENPFKPS